MTSLIAGLIGISLVLLISIAIIITMTVIGRRISQIPDLKQLEPPKQT